MPSFTGNKYPEELRALRAQYPNTQFDSHGRVVGGMPLNQYNAQPANPAAIPASVRTYSQFDPATGTWIRHTNGAVSPVQGMTPTNTPGIYLRPRQQTQPQPQPARQVRRPLARGNAVDISAAIAPQPIVVNGETALGVDGRGVTPSGIEFVGGQPVSLDRTQNIPTEHDGEIRSANGIPASFGVVGQPVVNVDSAEIGQSVPIAEATPKLDMAGNQWWSEARKPDSFGRNIMTAFAAPVDLGLTLTGLGADYRLIKGANAAYKAGRGAGLIGRGGAATASRVPVGPAPLAGSGAAANALPNAAQPSRLAGLQRLAIDGAGRLYDATADFAKMAYDRAAQLGARVRAGNWWTR